MIVRDAEPADMPAILAIHNSAIAESTAIWDTAPTDLDERISWWAHRRQAGFPVLVADIDGAIAGYASYGPWRPKSGYRFTVENSVYVADAYHRRGVATALMTALIERAAQGGVHVIVAGIESANHSSIALHNNFGFRVVGELPQVGAKFDRWLDLTLMQLTLPGPVDPAA
ncbi:GNAT family N-acetyltransferase [Aldersonia sp. NBC_00410]|uniref:GNAT family N-acetyltransferase n=1 Tax=Aldersonia sp. NBC_00410 TaxID=2975954 RepID=UPI002258E51C|nr:GNAT family N-acetyltransferase [Aldersonia sp. NBC_00410]MCX5042621.1 GNAT family N-acetyltransferase [Aldersonia sp. NBC_00410]